MDCVPAHHENCSSGHSKIGNYEINYLVVSADYVSYPFGNLNEATFSLKDDDQFFPACTDIFDYIAKIILHSMNNRPAKCQNIRAHRFLNCSNVRIELVLDYGISVCRAY